jgi:hypothetical protein
VIVTVPLSPLATWAHLGFGPGNTGPLGSRRPGPTCSLDPTDQGLHERVLVFVVDRHICPLSPYIIFIYERVIT